MAQEARLKLRMQKELKLLLVDPPHGASFPTLSSQSDITDLSSIHAQIEGPEETVYSKGIFKIKIQIPERYPLQPPIVTFATPIYHPNIDNGGRICLDILNLPPKGAWQPSLNISTVLTSIRLLLSEPNPDDGLMCEASREYKYNRQAFDQKARSMTEKYAKACSYQCTETKVDSTMVEVQGLDQASNHGGLELSPSNKRTHGISQKLSLESTILNNKKDADQKVPNHNLFLSASGTQMECKRKREKENDVLSEYNLNHEKVNGKGRKSSSKVSGQFKDDFDNKENVDPNYLSSLYQHQASSESSFSLASDNQQLDQHEDDNSANSSTKSSSKLCQSQKDPFGSMEPMQTFEKVKILGTVEKSHVDRTENICANKKTEKLSSVGKKLSLGLKGSAHRQQVNNKENVMPVQNLPYSKPQTLERKGLGRKLSLIPSTQQLQQGCRGDQKPQSHQVVQSMQADVEVKEKGAEEMEQESSISEKVVVLDSEDSEGEKQTAPLRTRMPLAARKRLGRWRV
ncbi:uncharacterized protein LOC108455817 [Gossypium arboreum]|uniref:UBC core domain-containing protein n=1 Tax=Gossypium arboreum TaxID=29729 RepID=A0ABR0PJD8_GOSAR|nr:uncharacterized protein LOC108455817 [Gossypium arboreum]KAK5824557.1 hypothetical protein PVK06_019336 [Gossypium arboreum]